MINEDVGRRLEPIPKSLGHGAGSMDRVNEWSIELNEVARETDLGHPSFGKRRNGHETFETFQNGRNLG